MSPVANNRGWTLPELVTVIAVLAIVAAIAAPRSLNRDVFTARAYAVELASAARLSRAIAVASGCPVRLQIDNSGYLARQPAALGTHCGSAAGGYVRTVARASGGILQGPMPANLPFPGNLQWTFNSDGSVNTVGGNTVAAGPHLITVDPANGTIAGP